jgi:hypothetical protein
MYSSQGRHSGGYPHTLKGTRTLKGTGARVFTCASNIQGLSGCRDPQAGTPVRHDKLFNCRSNIRILYGLPLFPHMPHFFGDYPGSFNYFPY